VPANVSGVATVFVEIAPDVRGVLTLAGNLLNGTDVLQIQQIGMKTEAMAKRARVDFMASSFTAMLGMAGPVTISIPDASLSLDAYFDGSLLEVSNMMERRNLALRIMTIERANAREFELPNNIAADEVESIARAYHAIVERSFDWPIPSVTVFSPATREMLAQFRALSSSDSITLGPDPQFATIFNQQIRLGDATVTIKDAFIDDWTKIEQELNMEDDHSVTILVRSRTHRGRYHFLNPPQPRSPLDPFAQRFVDLETLLDRQLIEGYNKLALATLSGLNEEQRNQLTASPTLDGEAFQ